MIKRDYDIKIGRVVSAGQMWEYSAISININKENHIENEMNGKKKGKVLHWNCWTQSLNGLSVCAILKSCAFVVVRKELSEEDSVDVAMMNACRQPTTQKIYLKQPYS